MVFDLVNNVLKIGVSKKTFQLLRENKITKTENGFEIIYDVENKFGIINSEGGTNLKLNFDKDSILQYWEIHEYWYKP